MTASSSDAIERVEIFHVDLAPKVVRSDAIQSFVKQETPIVRITCRDGAQGTGYAYTIGTGGSSVVALLRDHLAPRLIGGDAFEIERLWKELFFATHATAVGAITSLALAAIDTALWDLKCRRIGLPLWKAAGGAQLRVPVYTTEGGWLHHSSEQLVKEAKEAKSSGFKGAKIKVGRPSITEDVARLAAVRESVGDAFALMVDANQAFTVAEARRRAHAYDGLDLGWLEEPLPAEDVSGHVELASVATMPIAVGESLYHPAQFREYLERRACSIVQVDCARIGGITPWLKVAHLAEAFNVAVCPHFLMELHVSLTAAVPNGAWVEYIPQLDGITTSRMTIVDGYAIPPDEPGLGIEWDFAAIERLSVVNATVH
ncbi:MAG TPA: mandelate racemase/muconate lactonizing enzyme family protein [Casimicrobiaceae bacterium]|nr:mandelate racemase/muconate lactonizing enzyme family protein [Casimicrobiaceae bacterium]